jgi:hypothetical protein
MTIIIGGGDSAVAAFIANPDKHIIQYIITGLLFLIVFAAAFFMYKEFKDPVGRYLQGLWYHIGRVGWGRGIDASTTPDDFEERVIKDPHTGAERRILVGPNGVVVTEFSPDVRFKFRDSYRI